MHFQGIFYSVLSFTIVIVCQPVLVRAAFRFSGRIWPLFLILGVILLLLALFAGCAWLSLLFCTAALTFIHGALQLKADLTGCASCQHRSSSCQRRRRKNH